MDGCSSGRLRAGGAEIDLTAREVLTGGDVRRLEPRAAAVLAALVRAEGAVVGRETLLDVCWPPGEGSDEALTQAVAQIRRACGDDPRRPRFVGTVHRRGYRWLARERVDTPAAAPWPAPHLISPPRRAWRLAAALGGVALLGALVGAGALKAAAKPEPRLQIQTEDVTRIDGETVRTSREYNGTRADVRAAMAANGEVLDEGRPSRLD